MVCVSLACLNNETDIFFFCVGRYRRRHDPFLLAVLSSSDARDVWYLFFLRYRYRYTMDKMTSESATIHTLVDDVLDVPMFLFISILWKQPDFPKDLLANKIFVKDLIITPWAEVNGKNSRRITGKHPIPGFSWLPWLPVHTNTDKHETMEFVKERKELTIKEFSKIDGIPWHDIDVNLCWKVRDMGQQVHVVVTVQIVFHTGFIQAFAEMAALGEIEKFFAIWKVDARQAIADGHRGSCGSSSSSSSSSSNSASIMMEGPLASILSEVANSSSVSMENINPSCLQAVSHDDEGMGTWRSVVVDGESAVGVPMSSHATLLCRADSCEGTAGTNPCDRSDSPISFVSSAFTGRSTNLLCSFTRSLPLSPPPSEYIP